MSAPLILALDQGTTSTRTMSFGRDGQPRRSARREFAQHYPQAGWVEHDPEDIWRDALATLREVGEGEAVEALGITNQRETVVLWDRATGQPVHNAIVWQDRRTADACARLQGDGCEPLVRERTGLLLDPYFSGTKLAWLLNEVPGVRARAIRGELAFGTIDSFLLWRLTGGRVHATDPTNASRTLLYDIHRGTWDDDLLRLFDIPAALLPEVHDSSTIFGETDRDILGRAIPIGGIAGDQQAALVGQACFTPGDVKSTYGTGCFALLNTGAAAVASEHGLLTTIAYRLGGVTTYALEGSIFVAGAAVKWLRDGLRLITHAADTEGLATMLNGNHGVYMVPAFVGLGAPHWDPHARASITGLTFDATAAHIARAALEAVAYQTADLFAAMAADGSSTPGRVRVDGGMAANDWFCQFLADMLDVSVERPANVETTAAGAAFLAGMAVGLWSGPDAVAASWRADRLFSPRMATTERAVLAAGWRDALARTLST